MKKAWDEVKSFVTILFSIALVGLLYLSLFISISVFETVFLLYTNVCTAVFTYFFTKKSEVKQNDNDIQEDDNTLSQ